PLFAVPAIYPSLIISPLVFLIVYLILQYRFITTLHPIAEQVRASFGRMNSRLAETIEGLQVVKGAAREEQEIRAFDSLADEVRNYFVRQGYIEARYLPFLLLGLVTVFAFIHAVILYQDGVIDTGQIVAFMGQIFLFHFPVFSSLRSLS